jgi:hypothetical protein
MASPPHFGQKGGSHGLFGGGSTTPRPVMGVAETTPLAKMGWSGHPILAPSHPFQYIFFLSLSAIFLVFLVFEYFSFSFSFKKLLFYCPKNNFWATAWCSSFALPHLSQIQGLQLLLQFVIDQLSR